MDRTAAQLKSETLINIASLRAMPAFAWYVEKCIRPAYEDAERVLHAVRGVTQEDREIAAHVSDALRKILEWPDDQFTRNNDHKQG